ncbi:Ldh family oxidoreductase [Paracoccus sp. (in: a-proteobacteria)]|uniref:Ldh family oxidoreductase n=1 Tax=Paracoccus sp. TaxID=267 RepID=UPI0026E09474|nr:Ldh family oxidoreductase [Paracoccus sp. (in: a-proteobacteria)]MDO5370274.1 Ldh family oxidoreductase [Paracoccus sp. (in: a-proteobacteria)]
MPAVSIPLDEIRALACAALTANGMAGDQAGSVADVVTRAEADGCRSHGLYRIPGYVAALRAGRANGAAVPRIAQPAPSVLQVDGDRGFAPFASDIARPRLIETARRQGIAAMAIGNSHHFSALWADIEPLVEAGLLVWCFMVGQSAVAPHGGRRRLMGTNPVAFGWPRPDGGAYVFDFATSAAARGEVELKLLAGEPVPLGWGVDPEGRPTTDPAAVLSGALLPFGGHKGSALSMMVELIAGPLIGEMTSRQVAELDIADGGPPPGGELYIVLDPAAFGTDARTAGESFFADALSQPGPRLPGQRRLDSRRRSRETGVEVSQALLRQIEDLLDG